MATSKSGKKINDLLKKLRQRANWVRIETIKIHKTAAETRLASSLSAVEIFTVLYYGKLIRFDPDDVNSEERDRFIISKGHGAISFYPILADCGYFPKTELLKVCKEGSFLGGIPDSIIPGFETINGSLGHGLGVGCGVALALKRKGRKEKVFVLMGDGELYEGSVWEAVMFAGEHGLDNLILIVDNNKVCMLDYCRKILDLTPISSKFNVFKWDAKEVDGHNIKQLYDSLGAFKKSSNGRPKVLIANTIKGKGVKRLETDALSHIKNLSADEADTLIAELE